MSRLALLIPVLCAGLNAFASAADGPLRVEPNTIFAIDSVAQNHHEGPFRLAQYGLDGGLVGILTLQDTAPLGIPVGVTVIGGDVFVAGTQWTVAQVNLDTGELIGLFPTDVVGLESLGDWKGELLLGSFHTNSIEHRTREGALIKSVALDTDVDMTGVETDGTQYFVASYLTGLIHRFDLAGNSLGTIPTGLGSKELTGLSYDAQTHTLWVTTGLGSDELRQYALDGTLLDSFPAGLPFLNGVDFVSDTLFLDASPNFAITGDTLTFSSWGGVPGEVALHALTSVDGAPLFFPLQTGLYSGAETFEWQTPVPPGLAPLVLGHTVYSVSQTGQLLASEEERVHHH